MCNQTNNIPSVSLATAVLMQVQEFANSGQRFSRYDVTTALRQKCNDGLLEIPEVENPSTEYLYNINKAEVDSIFNEYLENCFDNTLPPLEVSFNGRYREFYADVTQVASSPVQVPKATMTSPQTVPPATVPVFQLNNMGEITRRIQTYLGNCNQRGVVPTLKQLQSAIKRGNKSTGLTCNELQNLVVSLGYSCKSV